MIAGIAIDLSLIKEKVKLDKNVAIVEIFVVSPRFNSWKSSLGARVSSS